MRGWREDLEWQVRFSCLVSLGNLRDLRAVPICVAALKSDNDLLVQAAVGACGDLGDFSALPELLHCLGSEDVMTRQRLAHALGCFSPPGEAVIDALMELTNDASFAVREAAVDSLGTHGISVPENGDELQLEREVAALLAGNSVEDAKKRTEDSAERAVLKRLERSFNLETSEEPDGASSS